MSKDMVWGGWIAAILRRSGEWLHGVSMDAPRLNDRFGLTKREAEAALLLVDGLTNVLPQGS